MSRAHRLGRAIGTGVALTRLLLHPLTVSSLRRLHRCIKHCPNQLNHRRYPTTAKQAVMWRRDRPSTPRSRATSTRSCWLRVCGTAPSRTGAKQPGPSGLKPDHPTADYNLGEAPNSSGHYAEAAQRFLDAKERYWVGSESWAVTTAAAFNMLTQEDFTEVAKPEWWNDEGLKALSARVVRAAPDDLVAHQMRALVLCGRHGAWAAGPRSSAELKEAATHWDRAAALHTAPAMKAGIADQAALCRSQAEAM